MNIISVMLVYHCLPNVVHMLQSDASECESTVLDTQLKELFSDYYFSVPFKIVGFKKMLWSVPYVDSLKSRSYFSSNII